MPSHGFETVVQAYGLELYCPSTGLNQAVKRTDVNVNMEISGTGSESTPGPSKTWPHKISGGVNIGEYCNNPMKLHQ